nr:MAG: hypothetical protein [Trichoderma atroviride partitivirus 1]
MDSYKWQSLDLATHDLEIRHIMADLIVQHSSDPKPAASSIMKEFAMDTTSTLVGYTYYFCKLYLDSDEFTAFAKQVKDHDQRADTLTSMFYHWAHCINERPPLRPHITALDFINALLKSARTTNPNPLTYRSFVTKYYQCIIQYAHSCIDVLLDMDIQNQDDFEQRANIYSQWICNATKCYSIAPVDVQDTKNLIQDHSVSFANFVTLLKDPMVPDSIIVFLLSQTLSTAGLAIVLPVCFPLFAHLIPKNYISPLRDTVWEYRYFDDAVKGTIRQPNSVGSSEHLYMDNRFIECIRDLNFGRLKRVQQERSEEKIDKVEQPTLTRLSQEDMRQRLRKAHKSTNLREFTRQPSFPLPMRVTTGMSDHPIHEPLDVEPTNTAPVTPVLRTSVKSMTFDSPPVIPTSSEPKATTVSTTVSSITTAASKVLTALAKQSFGANATIGSTEPDDTDYIPDPILNFQMRDFVSHIRSLDEMPLHLDHMERFACDYETPWPLTRLQVRPNDARAFQRSSRNNRMFVITFTRKNRKPIFNPVD